MNPLGKVCVIIAGLFWAIIFAMAIPMSTRTLARRILKTGFRNGKRSGKYGRMQSYEAQTGAIKFAGCPDGSCFNFPGIPCFVNDMELYKFGYAEPTYEDLARDPLSEYNWRSDAGIPLMLGYDCMLSATPYASRAWCTRPMLCYPTDSNATTCDCWWHTVSLEIGKRYPVKRNANRKITHVINFYTHDTQELVRKITINSHGMAQDLTALFTPGDVWKPSWDEQKRIGTTSYYKTYCNTYFNLKECMTLHVSEDLRPAKKVTAPVGMMVLSLVFLGLDMIAFMVLFAIEGGVAKVGPAK